MAAADWSDLHNPLLYLSGNFITTQAERSALKQKNI